MAAPASRRQPHGHIRDQGHAHQSEGGGGAAATGTTSLVIYSHVTLLKDKACGGGWLPGPRRSEVPPSAPLRPTPPRPAPPRGRRLDEWSGPPQYLLVDQLMLLRECCCGEKTARLLPSLAEWAGRGRLSLPPSVTGTSLGEARCPAPLRRHRRQGSAPQPHSGFHGRAE